MKRKQLIKSYLFAISVCMLCSPALIAQVTTATLSGIVMDPRGVPLVSATVTVEFPEAGIKQSLITKSDGRFTVPNLRVGGPYKVSVDHVSYQQEITNDIF